MRILLTIFIFFMQITALTVNANEKSSNSNKPPAIAPKDGKTSTDNPWAASNDPNLNAEKREPTELAAVFSTPNAEALDADSMKLTSFDENACCNLWPYSPITIKPETLNPLIKSTSREDEKDANQ